MIYAKLENNSISQYPYTMKNIRADNKNTSFPVDALSESLIRDEYGVVEVMSTEATEKFGYKAIEGQPKKVGDNWTQVWDSVAKTLEELVDGDVVSVEKPTADGFDAIEGSPEFVDGEWRQTWNLNELDWVNKRLRAYGLPKDQIEFITENGLEAWQSKVAEIKAKYPKS
jgi:hypothetical protein